LSSAERTFTEVERDDLTRMLEYLPVLATLRRFADRVYWLFDTPKDLHQAGCRRAAIVRDPAFRAVPEMAYLNSTVSRRVRTKNHVERTNRLFRFLEKVRYKWRRRRTLVRFVVLKLDEVWSHWVPPKSRKTDLQRAARRRKLRPQAGRRARQAA
jgi:hypothetical protein